LSTTNFKKISISSILKSLRGYKGVTVSQLAKDIQQVKGTTEKYEFDNRVPPINILFKMAAYFGVSIDFLLLSSNVNYIRNTELLKLSEKFDKLESDKRYKVESTMETFLNNSDKSTFDSITLGLTDNIQENIKLLRTNKGLSQKELADYLEINKTAVCHYENRQKPSPENLVKLSLFFDISIHALITGKKLAFNFMDKAFENTVLKADKQLSLEDQKFIIKLMNKIIETSS
jgi:transcriptional regulator with XRE-family HTH domain